MNYSSLPLIVRDRYSSMNEIGQASFLQEYERSSKSIFSAYIFWLVLGWHYAYVRKWGLQILFLLTLGGFLIWWIIDLFRVNSLVRNYNKDLAITIMKDITLIHGNTQSSDTTQNEDNPFEKWKKANPHGTLNDFYKKK